MSLCAGQFAVAIFAVGGREKKSNYVIDIYLDRMKVLRNAGREENVSQSNSCLGGKLILNCYMPGYMS